VASKCSKSLPTALPSRFGDDRTSSHCGNQHVSEMVTRPFQTKLSLRAELLTVCPVGDSEAWSASWHCASPAAALAVSTAGGGLVRLSVDFLQHHGQNHREHVNAWGNLSSLIADREAGMLTSKTGADAVPNSWLTDDAWPRASRIW
jgi:hypothetical protein